MHGLINKAIQSFVINTYGRKRWVQIAEAASLGFTDFEAMLIYDAGQTQATLKAICENLDRGQDEVLEDVGTFLISNKEVAAVRRLLRFGGVDYEDFLHSLDELPDRARLAVDDLHLPALEVREHDQHLFTLTVHPGLPGFANVMTGILRAMADEYGALVMLDHCGCEEGAEKIRITLVETEFAEGRHFDLSARAS